MAYSKTTASLVSRLVLIVSLVFIFTLAESQDPTVGIPLACTKVQGVKNGETCVEISGANHVTMDKFSKFNPGLDCEKLFVGQWLCIQAAV